MYRLLSCMAVVIAWPLPPPSPPTIRAKPAHPSINGCQRQAAPPASGAAATLNPWRDEAFIWQHGHLPGRRGGKPAPPASAASDPSKPNPTMGTEKE